MGGIPKLLISMSETRAKKELEARLRLNQESKETTRTILDNLWQAIVTNELQLRTVDARLQME